jgi:hypothetical protein
MDAGFYRQMIFIMVELSVLYLSLNVDDLIHQGRSKTKHLHTFIIIA